MIECEILCTLGPASLNRFVVPRLAELGVSRFRINLSHTELDELPGAIELIQSLCDVPVCIDTEGAQIRGGRFADGPVDVRDNDTVTIHRRPVPGDRWNWNLNPIDIVEELEVGDLISIDFNMVLLQVMTIADGTATLRVLNGGAVGNNKAVTVERDIPLPALSPKDIDAIRIARDLGVRDFALSFANYGTDVEALRALVGDDAFVISKIECINGLRNIAAIAAGSDALLIDRGDLSRQVPIEHIPAAQKAITRKAQDLGIKVYVATNLLESMVTRPEPTRGEVNDIFNTLADGADGLVLAAETAIGEYPIHCVSMVRKLIKSFATSRGLEPERFRVEPISLLPEPHGGALVRQKVALELAEIDRLPTVTVAETDLMDCQQIAVGTFSPLTGFMGAETLESVLEDHVLSDGTAWPLPIVLQLPRSDMARFGPGDRIALKRDTGEVAAVLDVSEIYDFDVDAVARKWYGTIDHAHPGVARLAAKGDRFVAGRVWLARRSPTKYSNLELTPAQTRLIFARKGWMRVVGFHSRNVAHRAHEYMQLEALTRVNADGLFINPVIGPKKSGDFLPGPIVKSYEAMLEFGIYPAGRVVLGVFASYPRYAGPREAVFTAICHKNFGCSHFIVGRDHTGVGDFYPAYANREIFARSEGLGVEPVFFDEIGYNPADASFGAIAEGAPYRQISGTIIRETLQRGEPLDEWVMRDVVQNVIYQELRSGRPLFVE